MRILLLGPPASGKGTIARKLGQHFDLPVLSVGKFLRNIPKDSQHYDLVNEVMKKGELVPNHILGKMLSELVEKDSRYENGYIVEGWGRQTTDFKFFDPDPHLVILLKVSKKTSWERISNRRICEKAGHTYNLAYKPPQNEDVCDLDGSKLVMRADDNRKTFEKRWQVHENKTTKSIKYFKKLGKLIEVSAESTPEEIFQNILKKIKTYK